ncbi:MAG: porin family protein [Gammaproteobacteria bacterium]
MKQFGCSSLLVLAGILAAPAAVAEPDKGFYATAIVGLGFLGSEDLNYRDGTVNSTAEGDFEASFNGGGAIGYRFNKKWRVEHELMYRRNELDALTLEGIGAATEGDYASLSGGFSALYDFKPFDNDRLSAYVGAGVVWVQEIDIDFEVAGDEISFETDAVGVQLQFGGRYDLFDNVYVDAGVRYLSVSGVEMELPADTTRIVEADYSPLSITVGLGWRF